MICARTKGQKTHCGNAKFMNILKLSNWFNSYSDFEGFIVLCLVVEFHRGGSAAKGATLSNLCTWNLRSNKENCSFFYKPSCEGLLRSTNNAWVFPGDAISWVPIQ